MMMLTSGVLTFLAVNFYKMIFTKEAHERKMKKQMEETLEATRPDDGIQAGSPQISKVIAVNYDYQRLIVKWAIVVSSGQ